MKINVVLVDDSKPAIDRMAKLINMIPDLNLVGQSTDPEEGIRLIQNHKPHLVFLDIEMPKLSGLELIKYFRDTSVEFSAIMTTGHKHYVLDSLRNNAFDYLTKPVSIKDLKMSVSRFKREVFYGLSDQEFRIIKLIVKGYRSEDIANEIHLARSTVDSYRKKILFKTGAKNSADLVRLFLDES